jgi:hypothetical protein
MKKILFASLTQATTSRHISRITRQTEGEGIYTE